MAVVQTPHRKASVILPAYNHAEFLPQAVEAILAQTFTDFELIIVNDGSTDNTQAYLETLTDPRIKVINRENGGLPSALNCGFAEASGEFFTWTSADNVTGPAWLEQLLVGFTDAAPSVGFVYSGFSWIDVNGNFLGIHRNQKMQFDRLAAGNVGMASFLYRASVAQQVGLYDETLNGAEDWDMWLRILEVSDAKYVDDMQYYYRLHNNSMTRSIPDKIALASQGTLQKLRLRHGNGFDMQKFYPCLHLALDQSLAQWQAPARLGSILIESRFCQADWTVELLVQALRMHYTPQLHQNLVVFLCRCGRWDLALFSIDQFLTHYRSPELENLRLMVEEQNPFVLDQLPISHISDADLVFELGHRCKVGTGL